MSIEKSSVLEVDESVSLHSSVLDLFSHLYSIFWLFLTSALAETEFFEIISRINIL